LRSVAVKPPAEATMSTKDLTTSHEPYDKSRSTE